MTDMSYRLIITIRSETDLSREIEKHQIVLKVVSIEMVFSTEMKSNQLRKKITTIKYN